MKQKRYTTATADDINKRIDVQNLLSNLITFIWVNMEWR